MKYAEAINWFSTVSLPVNLQKVIYFLSCMVVGGEFSLSFVVLAGQIIKMT